MLCLSSFDERLQRLSRWLERMDVRLSTELPEGRHSDQEKAMLERVEEFQHEALKERSDNTPMMPGNLNIIQKIKINRPTE